MKELRVLFLFLILLSLTNCAELRYAYGDNNGNATCLKEIIGKWEVVGFTSDVHIKNVIEKIPDPEVRIWIFNDNGIINKKNTSSKYELWDYCRKLTIEDEEHSFVYKVQLNSNILDLIQYPESPDRSCLTLKKIK